MRKWRTEGNGSLVGAMLGSTVSELPPFSLSISRPLRDWVASQQTGAYLSVYIK